MPECIQLGADESAAGLKFIEEEIEMKSCFRKSALLAMMMALSALAFAKPAHVLFHMGKKVVHPVRHPKKTSHSVWTFLTEVF